MYWEARSEGRPGMEAVGWEVLNRVASAEYPGTVCEVVREGERNQHGPRQVQRGHPHQDGDQDRGARDGAPSPRRPLRGGVAHAAPGLLCPGP